MQADERAGRRGGAGVEGGRRFYGFGEPVGPGSVTIFALRDHREITVSFDDGSVSPDAVQAALDTIARGDALPPAMATVTPSSPDAA